MSTLASAAALLPVLAPDVTVEPGREGSPGFLGFVATFALALALVGLFLSLTRHLRKVDRNAKALEERERVAAGPSDVALGVDDARVGDARSGDAGVGEAGSDEAETDGAPSRAATDGDAAPGTDPGPDRA